MRRKIVPFPIGESLGIYETYNSTPSGKERLKVEYVIATSTLPRRQAIEWTKRMPGVVRERKQGTTRAVESAGA